MTPSGGQWPLLTVLGPILIIIAIAWAIMRNRKTSRADLERTERGTRENYAAQDAQDKRRDGSDAT